MYVQIQQPEIVGNKHEHSRCEHDLEYCSICDVVYCTKCEKEWNSYKVSFGGISIYSKIPGEILSADKTHAHIENFYQYHLSFDSEPE